MGSFTGTSGRPGSPWPSHAENSGVVQFEVRLADMYYQFSVAHPQSVLHWVGSAWP